MLLWSAYRRKAASVRPIVSFSHALSWGLMGLWFGLVTTFDWQAIRTPPLVFLVIAAFVGSVIVAVIGRPKTTESSM
jgi:hypothetical protein